MKIAILISGEYRTFAICRQTMTFLDDLDNDVYFCTWNMYRTKNLYLNIEYNEVITEERIRIDLNRNAEKIIILDIDDFNSSASNPIIAKIGQRPMIKSWFTGLQLIKDSGKKYDYILVLRPDLFFNISTEKLNQIAHNLKANTFYCGHSPNPYDNKINLNDWCFFTEPDILFNLIHENFGNDYVNKCFLEGGVNFHTYFYDYVSNICNIDFLPPVLENFIICRPQPNIMTWELANLYYKTWLDSAILEKVDTMGIKAALKNWGHFEVKEALKRMAKKIDIR